MERLPDFLIIGAAKSGTTTLFADLGAHREVFFPVVKEPGDLARPGVLEPSGLAAYKRLFAPARHDQIVGEASTIYTARPIFEGAAGRAARVFPTPPKLVYLVRDPLERLISEHRYSATIGKMSGDINVALTTDAWLIEQSRYAYQLRPWLDTFGPDVLRVLVFEEYIGDREAHVRGLFRFLGVTDDPQYRLPQMQNKTSEILVARGVVRRFARTEFYRRNVRRWIPSHIRDRLKPVLSRKPQLTLDQRLSEANERMLFERLRPEVAELHAMLGWTSPRWPRFA